MATKTEPHRFILAWAAYVGVTFLAGFVWHLVLFRRVYAELGIFSRLDDPIVPLGLTAMLIQGAVLAYLYPRVSPRDHPRGMACSSASSSAYSWRAARSSRKRRSCG